MLSKEEIEKIKELSHYCALKNIDREDNTFGEFVVIIQKARNYIEQIETENKELKELQAKANKYNSLIKEIEEKIKEIGEYSDMARELIEEKIVIADSDSLNFGRQQAHNKDREVLRELLYKQKEKV